MKQVTKERYNENKQGYDLKMLLLKQVSYSTK